MSPISACSQPAPGRPSSPRAAHTSRARIGHTSATPIAGATLRPSASGHAPRPANRNSGYGDHVHLDVRCTAAPSPAGCRADSGGPDRVGRGQLLRRAGPGARRALLASFDAMGYLVHSASSVEAIAVLAAAQGEARLAERLLGAAAGQLERVGAAIPVPSASPTTTPQNRAAREPGGGGVRRLPGRRGGC